MSVGFPYETMALDAKGDEVCGTSGTRRMVRPVSKYHSAGFQVTNRRIDIGHVKV